MKHSVTLAEVDGTELHIVCATCGLERRIEIGRAMGRLGPDLNLPGILNGVTRRCRSKKAIAGRCSTVFVSLKVNGPGA